MCIIIHALKCTLTHTHTHSWAKSPSSPSKRVYLCRTPCAPVACLLGHRSINFPCYVYRPDGSVEINYICTGALAVKYSLDFHYAREACDLWFRIYIGISIHIQPTYNFDSTPRIAHLPLHNLIFAINAFTIRILLQAIIFFFLICCCDSKQNVFQFISYYTELFISDEWTKLDYIGCFY